MTPAACVHIRMGNTCRFGEKCLFRLHSTPPSQGDLKELGAPAERPAGYSETKPVVQGSVVDPKASEEVVICQQSATDNDEWALDTAAAFDVANPKVQGRRGDAEMPTAM